MKTRTNDRLTYSGAGIDTEKEISAVDKMAQWLKRTFELRADHRPVLGMDYFANVIDVGQNRGIALSTDGVGSKLLIAQRMRKYDTVGIDCVAMNVNDVICVGAEPIAMLDYIAIQLEPNPEVFEQIAKGLFRGAEMANISIPGGETSQLPDVIKGEPESYPFDLVGMCIGMVSLDKIVKGQNLQPGDVIIGLRSSGIHSNGLSLARNVFFKHKRYDVDTYLPECRRTLGEELLEPTRIYVREVVDLLRSGVDVRALINITSDGLLNLARVHRDVGFVIHKLPEPHPVFSLIESCGNVSKEEMYRVYNMGVGFCVIVPEADVGNAVDVLGRHGADASTIGHVVDDTEKKVVLEPVRLVGKGSRFYNL